MSLTRRQSTCVLCGKQFTEDDQISIEPLIDPFIRYVAVHRNESTFVIRIEVERSKNEPKTT